MGKLYSGAEIVFKCLEDQNVDHIFGYPGGAVLPIYDELKNHPSIKHILVRHEQGAGHAAEGYARSSGKPGVVLVTSGPGATNVVTALTDAQHAGLDLIKSGLGNVTYGEAACGAYMATAAATDLYGSRSGVYTDDEDQLALTAYNYTAVNGKLYHDATKCFTNANALGTASTQVAAAGLLGAAITPLNYAQYEFIYPENLQAFGISANTNIGSTAVQLEITYRPDFPLATDGGDQGQQMSDAGAVSYTHLTLPTTPYV